MWDFSEGSYEGFLQGLLEEFLKGFPEGFLYVFLVRFKRTLLWWFGQLASGLRDEVSCAFDGSRFQLMCLSTRAWHPSDSLNAIISIPWFPQLVISPYPNPPKYEIEPLNFLNLRKRAPQFLILVFFPIWQSLI